MWSFSIHCTCKPCYHTNEVLKLLYIYTVLCNVCCYLLLPFSTQKALPRRVKQSGVRKSKIMKGTLTRNGLRKKDGHSNAFTMAPADSPAIIVDKLVAGVLDPLQVSFWMRWWRDAKISVRSPSGLHCFRSRTLATSVYAVELQDFLQGSL